MKNLILWLCVTLAVIIYISYCLLPVWVVLGLGYIIYQTLNA